MKVHFRSKDDIFTVCGRLGRSVDTTNMKWMITCKRCKVSVMKQMKEEMTTKFQKPKRIGEP